MQVEKEPLGKDCEGKGPWGRGQGANQLGDAQLLAERMQHEIRYVNAGGRGAPKEGL